MITLHELLPCPQLCIPAPPTKAQISLHDTTTTSAIGYISAGWCAACSNDWMKVAEQCVEGFRAIYAIRQAMGWKCLHDKITARSPSCCSKSS